MTLEQFLNRLLLTPLAPGELPPLGIPSAVALVVRQQQQHAELLLSRRSGALRHHPHQICFPGGRQDAADCDLWTTAERECEEELGISRGRLNCVARLPAHLTRSGYVFQPYKGEPEVVETKENLEVAHANSFLDAIKNGTKPSADIETGIAACNPVHLAKAAF